MSLHQVRRPSFSRRVYFDRCNVDLQRQQSLASVDYRPSKSDVGDFHPWRQSAQGLMAFCVEEPLLHYGCPQNCCPKRACCWSRSSAEVIRVKPRHELLEPRAGWRVQWRRQRWLLQKHSRRELIDLFGRWSARVGPAARYPPALIVLMGVTRRCTAHHHLKTNLPHWPALNDYLQAPTADPPDTHKLHYSLALLHHIGRHPRLNRWVVERQQTPIHARKEGRQLYP